jgi:hypothetical protein
MERQTVEANAVVPFRREPSAIEQMRIGRRAKMFCPVCLEMKAAWQGNDNDMVYLECGHSRPPYFLPSNGVSLEDILDNTEEAARLFPSLVPGIVVKGKPKELMSTTLPRAA